MKNSKFVKALCAMLLVCMLIPAVASAATVSLAYESGAIYLRKGPGRDYGENGTVHDGDTISVQSYGNVWSKVKTSDGRVGYIKNLYINDGDNNYASGTEYFDGHYSMYTTASVNLRAGASTSTNTIRTLSTGTKVRALGKNNGFYLVSTTDGTQGFVSSKYLSKNATSSSSSGSTSSYKTKTVTASYVNMRAGGGLSYTVVKVLPRGTEVQVLYTGNYWTRVKYNGTTGWIKNSYLR